MRKHTSDDENHLQESKTRFRDMIDMGTYPKVYSIQYIGHK
jgi:hypothetical protein